MSNGLTGTKHFGFSPSSLAAALELVSGGEIGGFASNPDLAARMGIGTIQLESLGAWMRLSGFATRASGGVQLTPLGSLVLRGDPTLVDAATWWLIHWRLSHHYTPWCVLADLPQGGLDTSQVDDALKRAAPDASEATIRNARTAVFRTLEDTPLGRELGLVELHSDGRRVTGLTKLPMRYGSAPLAAVAYAVLDWARREGMSSASLETLAGPHGPGPVLHMSEGVLERYLVDIDGAFRGRALSYSRTAGLNEAYIKGEVAPLQVLAAHYIHAREGLAWPEALERACGEVADDEDAD